MVRRALKLGAVGVVGLAALVVVLYQFSGLRVVREGSGQPRLRFTTPNETQAMVIARHREAQRAQGEPRVSPAGDAAAPPANDATPVAAPAPPTGSTAAPALFWTDFRGPRRDGVYDQRPINTNWPAGGLTPMWKQPAGGGYASFSVARGRAFTIEQRGGDEVVAAYDVMTGRELWTNAWPTLFTEFMGGDGPRATPTWSDGRVYALGAIGELRCLDEASGRVLWRVNILEDNGATNLDWGMAASPVIVDETVIVLPGGPNGRSVVAYDRRTGARAWSALDDKAGYSSPMLVTLAGVRQVLVFSASRLMGVTPDGGDVLWEYPWTTMSDVNVSQPLLIGDNRVFLSSGYGAGAAVLELAAADGPGSPPRTPALSGGGNLSVREVWRNTSMKNRFTSSVLHEGTIYGMDEAILAAVDAGTGTLKWKGGRYGHGQVLLAGGHLIVLTEDGDLTLVKANPDRHEELVRFPVLEGKTWNHPAMAGGYLLVRNLAEMAAFDLRLP
ncbi:MAG TPA: PQQ-binding-like beta-propeller repeat protein [Vicinamibacterales bacterium]